VLFTGIVTLFAKQLTALALIQNELYLIAKAMKKNVEDKILITKFAVYWKVRNVVN